LSASAREVWESVVPQLFAEGLLGREHVELARQYCEAIAMARAASGEIGANGVTIVTASGTRKANPACSILLQAQRRANDIMHKLESERATARILGDVVR
jgi:P27 family predicted phage terminase small subunit